MEELLKKWKQINKNYWYEIAVKQIDLQGCLNCLILLLITQGLSPSCFICESSDLSITIWWLITILPMKIVTEITTVLTTSMI